MEINVARQPIFDTQQQVYAYELLFQHPAAALTNSFLTIGMDTLTRRKKAFIQFNRNLLKKEVATIFPKELLAVEILANVEPDDETIAACKKLKLSGYFLVLDDFYLQSQFKSLVELADIIKVDFTGPRAEKITASIQRMGTRRIKFLANNLENIESYRQAVKTGYDYFQGSFFSKPDTISGQDVPVYKLNYLQLLKEINQPEVDFKQLEKLIKQDVSLSYKLFRFINSAHFGLQNEIRSIKHALALLGAKDVKKWLSLIALSSMGKDKSEELVVISVMRAGLCEMLATVTDMKENAAELYLMGLLSLMDTFMDKPMSDILTHLPISQDIKGALLGKNSRFHDVYELVLALEIGNWEQIAKRAAKLNLVDAENKLPELYYKALETSNQILSNST